MSLAERAAQPMPLTLEPDLGYTSVGKHHYTRDR
ncbi:MAG: hypothetical protein GFH27_549289n328 [Chloroflexi bacterium AL-W]|nr:hypothetical protein [Chloroflexi bacterium AL-N1]NOK67060.1 hypothetical protein [Chloroflexi bacterium AL-N10]NOK74648.1 hypothetical protein [Chloroflexi bacterium AL-N5]NOK81662.1 hypothetical protein [Chloroflexi bacterium AL-W]NOK89132.1 hypothetical protein [Chloroflexi bacterium AL-N15]